MGKFATFSERLKAKNV